MPRNNPKEIRAKLADDGGPNLQRIADRRDKRKARREAKSPDQGPRGALLSTDEVLLLKIAKADVRNEEMLGTKSPDLVREQNSNIERELDHNRAAISRA